MTKESIPNLTNSKSLNELLYLYSIKIPNAVTIINAKTFFGCTGLISILINQTLTSIDRFAFRNCILLRSITIPDSLSSIANDAFINCTSLVSVYISNTKALSLGGQRVPPWSSPSQTPHIVNFYGTPSTSTIRFYIPSP